MEQSYADILIRIRKWDEATASYPVEAQLDDGSRYLDGRLRVDEVSLRAAALDPREYGLELFYALLSGPIRRAYDKITGRAEHETEGRLRVRLWIDDDAAELHALPWERIFHHHRGQDVPLASSALTPFSRYAALPLPESRAVVERPIRLLCAVSNPRDLPVGLAPIDVPQQIETFCQALGDLRKNNQIDVILLPGRSGLPADIKRRLEWEGYKIKEGATSLDNILRWLPDRHVLHFIGHGHFQRADLRGEGHATLYLEKDDGSWQAVTDEEIAPKLAGVDPLPDLVFLAACESARQDPAAGHPFVGLGPKLVKAGIPAVVAMQDRVRSDVAEQLTGDFYRNLLEHGLIDLALNQARNLLYRHDGVDWAIPVLFMRLEKGQLFALKQEPDVAANVARVESILYTEPGVVGKPRRLFGRQNLLTRVDQALDRPSRMLLTGLGGAGKTALAAEIADKRIRDGKGPVAWLNCGDAEADTLFEALAGLAGQLGAAGTEQEIRRHMGDAKIKAVADLLARSPVKLLVLDDVREGKALKQVLMAAPDALPVLVTSRRHFPLDGEEVGDLAPDDAVALLGFHAGKVDFSGDAGARALCKTLGYHPYALEIAGNQLIANRPPLTPGELLKRFAEIPDQMPMPAEFAVEGRENVKRLLDTSCHGLDAQTGAAFQAFGTLPVPGATAELLAAYLGCEPVVATRALDDLAGRSLVKRRAATTFYSVHDLTFSYVRALARYHDQQPGEMVATIQRHVLAHAHDFDLLALDLAGVLGAAAATSGEALVSLMSALTIGGYPDPQPPSYFDARGHTLELLARLDAAIEAARAMGEERRATLHYLLGKRGNAYVDRGDFENAFRAYQDALDLAPDSHRQIMLLAALGRVRTGQRNYTEADAYYDRACSLAESTQDDAGLGFALEHRSLAAGERADYEAARQFSAQAVEVNRRINNIERLVHTLNNLGSAERELGVDRALSHHREALKIAEEREFDGLRAEVLLSLGEDYHAQRAFDQAQTYLCQALELFRRIGKADREAQVRAFMMEFGYLEPQ